MLKTLIAFLLLTVVLSSCWDLGRRPNKNPRKVLGYKPVYSTDPSLLRVQAMGPQAVQFAGKIYVKNNLIFQNDLGYGIHVIDNTNPASATRIGFIRVIGNTEMSIKGNYLYVNSFTDLVVVDVSDWQNVTEVKRIQQAFSQAGGTRNFIPLPEHRVYYECAGLINNTNQFQTGWVRDSVSTYSCYNP
jgi:hypothetical protein